jgi:hypothetical protein
MFWIYVFCALDLCLVLYCLESLLSLEVQRLDIFIFEPGFGFRSYRLGGPRH